MPDDPLLSYYGQPILPAGYNSWENDGDEIDGAGANEPTWPYRLDSFIPLEVLVITPEMLEVFEGCADYTVLCEIALVMVAAEQLVYVPMPAPPVYVPDAETEYTVSAVNNLITVQPKQSTLVII